MTNHINNKALFLGINAENRDFFQENLVQLFNDHANWRKNLYPEDKDLVTAQDRASECFQATEKSISDALKEMSTRLQGSSTPWQSPRYLGHMNAETLTPALLGYFGAMLYNANNVAYESSAPTSLMEVEVGQDLCKLMGMDKGWGHISADGSLANFEGLWYARNIKSLPLAIKDVEPNVVAGKSDWELLNMPIPTIMDLFEQTQSRIDVLKNNSARALAKEITHLGKWIVPETKHYSWVKAADVLGVGTNDILEIPVDDHFRMDIAKLKVAIDQTIAAKIPVLGVVCVVGTTEEGAVDHVDQIVQLREEYAKQGVHFYLHVDAAYGGYARSIFLDENYQFIPKDELKSKFAEHKIFKSDVNWPSDDVYNAFKAISYADSVTIDPHKMGYIPYSAGGIVIADSRMKDTISYFAAYVFEKGVKVPALLGSFIMEGSKAGATAAGVWVAHQVLPPNITGYGKVIGASIEGAYNLYDHIVKLKSMDINGTKVNVQPLCQPDFNMVDFVFNIEGNTDLALMNKLNEEVYNLCSIFSGHILQCKFVTSHTDFARSDYGEAPLDIVKRLGVPDSEWPKVANLTLIRSCVLTPYLTDPAVCDYYFNTMDNALADCLGQVIAKLK